MTCWSKCKRVQPLEKTSGGWVVAQEANRELVYDPAIPLAGVYIHARSERSTCRSTHVLVHEYSQRHDSQQPESRNDAHAPWPMGGEATGGKSTQWNIIRPEKGRQYWSAATAWMNLRNTTLSEGGQIKKTACCRNPFIWNLQNSGKSTGTKQMWGCQELPGEKAGLGEMRARSMSVGFFLGWWNILESNVVMVAQPSDYTKKKKITEWCTSKGWILWHANYISIYKNVKKKRHIPWWYQTTFNFLRFDNVMVVM